MKEIATPERLKNFLQGDFYRKNARAIDILRVLEYVWRDDLKLTLELARCIFEYGIEVDVDLVVNGYTYIETFTQCMYNNCGEYTTGKWFYCGNKMCAYFNLIRLLIENGAVLDRMSSLGIKIHIFHSLPLYIYRFVCYQLFDVLLHAGADVNYMFLGDGQVKNPFFNKCVSNLSGIHNSIICKLLQTDVNLVLRNSFERNAMQVSTANLRYVESCFVTDMIVACM